MRQLLQCPIYVLALALGACATDGSEGSGEPVAGGPDGCEPAVWYLDADGDGFGSDGASLEGCEAPDDYVDVAGDCDDTNPFVRPDAVEDCNLVDDDCDGDVDEGVQDWFHADADGDGFGDPDAGTFACGLPEGHVLDDSDCDDSDAAVNPDAEDVCNERDDDCDGELDEDADALWYADADGDGFGDTEATVVGETCDMPEGAADNALDCDDADPMVNPEAPDQCNDKDDDCDGEIDEDDDITWYADGDGDGHGDPAVTSVSCLQPEGYTYRIGDCDDSDASVNPDATDICNERDDDCDGAEDEDPDIAWYADSDSDGYGDASSATLSCEQPTGHVSDTSDCDDTDAAVHPGATDICNERDDDCDGTLDEDPDLTWYADMDSDGYGDASSTTLSCDQPSGYVSDTSDCDDTDASIHPAAEDICNEVDDDCDGIEDEDPDLAWYEDADCDGYGDDGTEVVQCTAPTDYIDAGGDCDDADSSVGPHVRGSCTAPDPYNSEQVMVLPASGALLSDIATDLDSDVLLEGDISTWGLLSVPEGSTAEEFIEDLLDHGDVDLAVADAYIDGQDSDYTVPAENWHLFAADIDGKSEDAIEDLQAGKTVDGESYTVAVIDSGVAYAAHTHDGVTYAVPDGLADVTFADGYDFVDDDSHPHDEHQHGTHIASIIASQDADYPGVVPGVSILPLRVLDADNSGSELALVEAIYFAAAEGVDVINLSLSFRLGYTPSAALLDAIDYAVGEGCILVAAAGNDGGSTVTWPAAHPDVLAVTATAPNSADVNDLYVPDWANLGVANDWASPGGDLSADLNGDGLVDGIPAWTIDRQDPSSADVWLMAGTSQAAAVASGQVVLSLIKGATASDMAWSLQKKAIDADASLGNASLEDGVGMGALQGASEGGKGNSRLQYMVGVLPYLVDNGDGTVTPTARLTLMRDGKAAGDGANETLYGEFHGSSTSTFSCSVGTYGEACTVEGEAVDATDSSGADAALLWTVSVDAVTRGYYAYRPESALFATDALELVLVAMDDAGALDDGSMLAFGWEEETDATLGDLAESYTVVNTGTGFASSPMGVVFTPALVSGFGTSSTVTLDLDATGFASSPMGKTSANRMTMSGTGFASSPMGFTSVDLLVLDGPDLGNTDLELGAVGVYGVGDGAYDSTLIDLAGGVVGMLEVDTDETLTSTALGDMLDAGGWVSETWHQAAAWLSVSPVTTEELDLYDVSVDSGSGSLIECP